ncbi:MAG: ABC transporter substrate-binding protein [Clostridia bacterium]|nr:ABC transporter substrate-binding protein [Clostridia bacterium]
MLRGSTARMVGFFMLIVLTALAGFGCGGQGAQAPEEQVKIGITQIVEHAALDAAREGFIDALKEEGYEEGKNVVYYIENAQNDKSNAMTIAQKFVSDKVDLILAISTPSAQACAQATKDIPILITAVTDPVAAGLVKSMDNPGTNVTGTTDMNPIYEQLELIKKFVPDAKKVGVIYNAGEVNSEVQVNMAEEAAGKLGLEAVKVTASTTAEVSQAAESLAGRVDAIYIPTDNTVVAALDSVIKVGEKNKIPVISGEGDSVKNGAMATYGINYYELGKQTGKMAVKILKGEDPSTMPVEKQKNLKLYINKKAAEAMGVEIPSDLLEQADEIYE